MGHTVVDTALYPAVQICPRIPPLLSPRIDFKGGRKHFLPLPYGLVSPPILKRLEALKTILVC